MNNTWKDYELFVREVQQVILNTEKLGFQKNISVIHNKKIIDNNDIERQFDLYWKFQIGGVTYETVIECKDYASSITIEKIDAFIGKTLDIPGLKRIYATKTGYQSGAKKKAAKHCIDLLIVREPDDSDFYDNEGNPYIKKIGIQMSFRVPLQILEFQPIVKNDLGKVTCREDQVFIIEDSNKRYSLVDLKNMLQESKKGQTGNFYECVKLYNSLIEHSNTSTHLLGYNIKYHIPDPLKSSFEIDLTEQLLAIIDNITNDNKQALFIDGTLKNL